MYTVNDIILELREMDARIFVEGGNLRIDARQLISDRLKLLIKSNKEELISYITKVRANHFSVIPAAAPASSYPLSSSQRRLWLLSQLEESNAAYNMPGVCWLEGELDVRALEKSFLTLIERHESLRTIFVTDSSGEVKQVIRQAGETGFEITQQDLRKEPGRETIARQCIINDGTRTFSLAAGPLLRAGLYRIEDARWIFTYTMHHICSDGWSMEVLIRELFQLYAAYSSGRNNPLLPLKMQYKDYASWQQEQLKSDAFMLHKKYWLHELEGELPVLQLPGDKPRPAIKTYNGAVANKLIDAAIVSRLKELGAAKGCTLFMGLLAAVNALLYLYTGQDDIIIGSPVAGRDHADLDEQIGFYVNTLALRTRFNGNDNYPELLEKIKRVTLSAYEHQAYPFDQLVKELALSRDMSRSALFDVMVVLQDTPSETTLYKAGNIQIKPYNESLQQTSKFDLLFNFEETEEGLALCLEYNRDIYEERTVARIANHLGQIIAAIVQDPLVPVNRLDYLDKQEKLQLLKEFNNTRVNYSSAGTLPALFEQQCVLTPGNIAIKSKNRSLTYKELNDASNQLARFLTEKLKLRKEDKVAILQSRSSEVIVSILGVLKAGGAYVPVDAGYPEERILYMLEDSGTAILLTEKKLIGLASRLQERSKGVKHLVCIDSENVYSEKGEALRDHAGYRYDLGAISKYSVENIDVQVSHNNLAYIIYTSGSTGRPKGVMIEHGSVVNYINWVLEACKAKEKGTDFTLVSSLSFDVSVTSIFAPLFSGNSIKLYDDTPDVHELLRKCIAEAGRNEILNITPAHISLLANMQINDSFPGKVIVAGEALRTMHVDTLKRLNPQIKIFNEYGPTEATVGCIVWEVPAGFRSVLIGKPIANTSVYILDEGGNLVPVGVAGEICIGGAGLARGYLNKEELTKEKFIINRYTNERIYRTGDLARWMEDGNIEFLGRKDDQVKIRAYRVELSEITAVIESIADIDSAVVVAIPNAIGEKDIVAYIKSDQPMDANAIRDYISKSLPVYMLPNYFIQLGHIPLTSNGKIDKKALPHPHESDVSGGVEYVAPRSEIEEQLVLIWQEVLGNQKIGVKDNFFDIGGDSLKIVKMAGIVSRAFNREIPVVTAFSFPTISSLAAYIHTGEQPIQPVSAGSITGTKQEPSTAPGVAIIGMACRFPGAKDHRAFWHNLEQGVESIHFFTDSELKNLGVDEATFREKNFVRAAAMLDNKDSFDAAFFNYTPGETKAMNPEHRVFHECVWEALEDAGCNPDMEEGPISLYAGGGDDLNWRVYSIMKGSSHDVDDFTLQKINNRDFLVSLVSYKLNLNGPAFLVDTACSTSLVAVNLACKSLLMGEAKIALAGGITVITQKQKGYLHQEGTVNSADGHCRAFDKAASGTVPGEGVGVVVLKRLADAVNDGDQIYCVIKGSAINNDGNRKVGFTAPGVQGQADCIRKAQELAGVDADSITYIEAHGTATRLGDPIEIEALNRAFNNNKNHRCAIGSVKSNIGHTNAAAGVAGLIKTALSLKYKKLPPSLHYTEPNPDINFANGPFYINNKLTEWERTGNQPLRAGVSSFGIGGTNAHAILEEAPQTRPSCEESTFKLLLLSARTANALERYVNDLSAFLLAEPESNLADVAYTLQLGRKSFIHRKSIVFKDREDLMRLLDAAKMKKEVVTAKQVSNPVTFLFSGAGSQYINMGRDLYEEGGLFKELMDEGFSLLKEMTGENYAEIFYPQQDGDVKMHEMLHTQPVIFLFGYSLARLLMSFGITPGYMIGHSIGEYIAACISGVFSFADALQLVVKRGQLMNSMAGGAMLSVSVKAADAYRFTNEKISLAAINGPDQVVFSGDTASVEELMNALQDKDISYVKLYASQAGHSHMIETIMADYEKALNTVTMNAPAIPFVSNLTGKIITAAQAQSVHYWLNHMRQTVQFATGIETLCAQHSEMVLIELGGGHSLTNLVRQQQLRNARFKVLNMTRHPKENENDTKYLVERIGKLWEYGLPIDWNKYYGKQKRSKISLPTYSFERVKYPTEVDVTELSSKLAGNKPESNQHMNDWFYRIQWKQSLWLPGSKRDVAGKTIMVFSDQSDLADAIVKHFRQSNNNCIVVTQAHQFEQKTNALYTLNPGREKDYEALFDALSAIKITPGIIIHLWNYENNVTASDPDVYYQNTGYESLLWMARCLASYFPAVPVQLDIIGRNWYNVLGTEMIEPAKAMSLGPVKVIPKEFPGVCCRAIDVDVTGQRSIDAVLTELEYKTNELEIAIRGKARYIRDIEKINMDFPVEQPVFRSKGTYFITGANGGMGRLFAGFLAEHFQANLILTGRSEADPGYIDELTKKGSSVRYIQSEIDDRRRLVDNLREAEAALGNITGVIHTAGVIDKGGVIIRRSAMDDKKVFASKVSGTRILGSYFGNRKLDFFVNCSSLSGTRAPFGEVAYVSANLYQDAFAEAGNVNFPVISIEWTAIKEIGAGFKATSHLGEKAQAEALRYGLSPQETIKVLEHAVYLKIPVLLICKQDLNQLRLHAEDTTTTEADVQPITVQQRPDMASAFEAPVTEKEQVLAAITGKFLGIDPIGINDNFFELGMDSLKAMVLSRRINKELGTALTIKDFFAYPTIKQMAMEIGTGAAEEAKFVSII
jgi:amino acid adenylation domain-containing protein